MSLYDIGPYKIAPPKPEPVSYGEFYQQSYLDSVKVANQDARIKQLVEAYDDVNDRIRQATGEELFNPFTTSRYGRGQLTQGDVPGDVMATYRSRAQTFGRSMLSTAEEQADLWKRRVSEFKQKYADKLPWDELINEPENRVAKQMFETRQRTNQMAEGMGWDLIGQAAGLAGGFLGSFESPIDTAANLAPIGTTRAAYSLLRNALVNAAANAAVQAPLSLAKLEDYRKAGLPYGAQVWASEVGAAALVGGGLDLAIRGPARALVSRYGRDVGPDEFLSRNTPRGGVVFDAIDPTRTPSTRISEAPQIDPEIMQRAQEGDIAAQRQLADSLGVGDDPAVKGALDYLEGGGKLDAEAWSRLRAMNVDDARGMRFMADIMAGRVQTQMPEPLMPAPEPMRHAEAVELARTSGDDIRSMIDEALEPRQAQLAADAFEAGFPRVVDAVKRLLDGDRSPEAIRQAVSEVVEAEGGAQRFADRVLIHSGRGNAIEMATAIRRDPTILDDAVPQTERVIQAMSMARMADDAWDRILAGDLPPALGAHIADRVAPQFQGQAVETLVKARPESLEEAAAILDETVPDVRVPEQERSASGIADPNGPEAQAQLEALRAEVGEAVDQAMALPREKERLEQEVEDLRAQVAKEDAEPKGDGEMASLSTRERLADAQTRLDEITDTLDARAGRLTTELITQRAAMRRQREVMRAISDAVQFARRITPEGTEVTVRDKIEYGGFELDASSNLRTGDIELSIRALDPSAQMGHEAVHTLVTKGLISPEEVSTLAAMARERGLFTQEAEYRQAYADRLNLDRLIDEEAAAAMIEARIAGRDTGPVNTAIERIRRFIERLRELLTSGKFRSREDIIDAVLSGEMAQRSAMPEWMRSADDRMASITDRDTGQSMRRDLDALGYYSQALEAARGLKQAKGTPEQMLAQLKKAGVKDAEIEATGLQQFLDSAGKSITRDQIVAHLEANRVGLNEVVNRRGDDAAAIDKITRDRISEWEESEREKAIYEKGSLRDDYIDDEADRWREFAEENGVKIDDDAFDMDAASALRNAGLKFEYGYIPIWIDTDYWVFGEAPNGKVAMYNPNLGFEVIANKADHIADMEAEARSYIDSDIIQADPQDMRREIRREVEHSYQGEDPTKWSDYSLDPSNPTYRETVLHLPEGDASQARAQAEQALKNKYGADYLRKASADELEAVGSAAKQARQQDFRSGHFSEPNIIGHMMTSMVQHEGRPTYLIDQIQSDWGQKLRDGGVRDEAKIAELREKRDKLLNRDTPLSIAIRSALRNTPESLNDALSSDHITDGASILTGDYYGFESKAAKEIFEKNKEFAEANQKRLEALQNLRDGGDVSVARESEMELFELYNQSARSDELLLVVSELRTAEAATSGNPLVNTTDQWVNTTLRRAIRQAAEADAEYIAVPSGDTVLSYNPGDTDGMRGFYDGIVPKNIRNILRKLDKASPDPQRVGKLETPTSGMKGSGFTVFPLTPEVKRKVMEEGQAMFSIAKRGGLDTSPEARKARAEAMGFDTSRVWYHGTNRDFDRFKIGAPGQNSNFLGSWDVSRAAVFLAEEQMFAEEFASQGGRSDGRVMQLYVRSGRTLDLTRDGFWILPDEFFEKNKLNPRYYKKLQRWETWEAFDNENDGSALVRALEAEGYDSARMIDVSSGDVENTTSLAVFNPSNIRSVNAMFDPAEERSANLMASITDRDTGKRGGLDPSPEARKARAEAMGFDTSRVWYHGTRSQFDQFEDRNLGVFFSDKPAVANAYAMSGSPNATGQNVISSYVNYGRQKVVDAKGQQAAQDYDIWGEVLSARREGWDSILIQNVDDSMGEGAAPSNVLAVFNPSNIRSVNAMFDPAEERSANLMASIAQRTENATPLEQDMAQVYSLNTIKDMLEACRG